MISTHIRKTIRFSLLLSLLFSSDTIDIGEAGGLYMFLCAVIVVSRVLAISGFIAGFVYIGFNIVWPSQKPGNLTDYIPIIVALILTSQAENLIGLVLGKESMVDCTISDFINKLQDA